MNDLTTSGGLDSLAGYVGMILGNAFMRREFGLNLVETFIPTIQLREVIDTSGAKIPGHNTPTMILVGQNCKPTNATVRTVLGKQEHRADSDPDSSTWLSIVNHVDRPGSESGMVVVEDIPRAKFQKHPWLLYGGPLGSLMEKLAGDRETLDDLSDVIGYTGQTNADAAFLATSDVFRRRGVEAMASRRLVVGKEVREWSSNPLTSAIFPYRTQPPKLLEIERLPGTFRWLWPLRTVLWARRTFAKKS